MKTNKIKIKAYAKLNLVLDVKNKRPDGFHEIEFINTQLDLHDVIGLEEIDEGIVIESNNPSLPTDSKNLCYKAAEIMISKLPQKKGIKIKITKNIPLAAGLGGGSADAAAVFRGLNQLWNLNLTQQELIDMAKTISTDTCYCIVGGTCLVKGKGEIIEKLDNIPKLDIAVITPKIELKNKTAWMYSQLKLNQDTYHPDMQQMLSSIKQQDKNMVICSMGNIFDSVNPEEYAPVKELIAELGPKCMKTMLAGSGPTIIAVTETALEAEMLAEYYAGMHTSTRQPKKTILAKGSGFCYGVRRALESVEGISCSSSPGSSSSNSSVYTLGPLIHNPQVIEQLEDRGIRVADSIDDIEGSCTLVIRAHGVPEKTITDARSKGLSVLDSTCPFVKSVQRTALDLEKKGYQPIIFGDPDHPEIIGIAGNLKNPVIVKSLEDISSLGKFEKAGIVCQTTQSEQKFSQVVAELRKHCDELIVHDTICSATKGRQDNAAQLAEQVDLMLVIGGRNSGNTKRLKELCSAIVSTIHIETAAELTPEMLGTAAMIGIAAGASTPDFIINEVIQRIENEF